MTATTNQTLAPWLEQAWLERYLNLVLSEDEVAWFETYLLDKPNLLQQVDADTRLRDLLRQQTSKESGRAVAEAAPAPKQSAGEARKPVRSAATGLAAALLLGLGVGHFLPARQAADFVAVANPPRMVFDTLRGQTQTALSEDGDAHSPWMIVDIAAPLQSATIEASAWVDGRAIALPTPTVSSEGFVTFIVPADWRGRARIELKTGSDSSITPMSLQL